MVSSKRIIGLHKELQLTKGERKDLVHIMIQEVGVRVLHFKSEIAQRTLSDPDLRRGWDSNPR